MPHGTSSSREMTSIDSPAGPIAQNDAQPDSTWRTNCLSTGERESVIAPMPIAPYNLDRGPQKLADLWTVSRGVQSIRCGLSTHPAGWELKLTASDSAFRTRICETTQAVRDTATNWRAEAAAKGWN